MEVHPPDHPIMTWKQFVIHMSTICLGLLIAIGLEQSVEALHRHHQRHQLEDDLRAEAIQNLHIAITNLDIMEALDASQTQQAEELDSAAAEGRSPRYIPYTPHMYRVPSEAVWTAAQSSITLNLLPRAEAQRFAHRYTVAAFVSDDVPRLNHLFSERSEILDPASSVPYLSRRSGTTYDLSRLSKDNLARYRDMTARLTAAARDTWHDNLNLYSLTWGTLHGYTDEETIRKRNEFIAAFQQEGGTAGLLKRFPIPDENSASTTEDK
jgi:hypothetical protein